MATFKLKRKYYSDSDEKDNTGLIIGGSLGALTGGTIGAFIKNDKDVVIKDNGKSFVINGNMSKKQLEDYSKLIAKKGGIDVEAQLMKEQIKSKAKKIGVGSLIGLGTGLGTAYLINKIKDKEKNYSDTENNDNLAKSTVAAGVLAASAGGAILHDPDSEVRKSAEKLKKDLSNVKKADIVYFDFKGKEFNLFGDRFRHYGIYDGKGNIIEFSGSQTEQELAELMKAAEEGKKIPVNMETKIKIRPLKEYLDQNYDIFIEPTKPGARDADAVIKDAMKQIGKRSGEYNLVTNNCEHFANEMKYGKHKSYQVNRNLKKLGTAIALLGTAGLGTALYLNKRKNGDD